MSVEDIYQKNYYKGCRINDPWRLYFGTIAQTVGQLQGDFKGNFDSGIIQLRFKMKLLPQGLPNTA